MVKFYVPKQRQISLKKRRVTIDSVDAFGQGVVKAQGKTIFVENALPTEEVEIQITAEKKQLMQAKVIKRFNDSPDRVEPRCQHYGECGGCQMQHIDLPLQHSAKQAALLNLLKTTGQAVLPPVHLLSQHSYGYRRRARFALIYQRQQKQLLMGFRQTQQKTVVNLLECPILVPALAQLMTPLRDCLRSLSIVTKLGHVELTAAENGVVVVLRILASLSTSDRQQLQAFANQHHLLFYVQTDETHLEALSSSMPYYQVDELKLSFSPQNFIQVNSAINEKMVAQAIDWLVVEPTDVILDLFCGMGNFSLPLAKRAKKVIGVEGVLALTEKSQQNAEQNQLSNVLFYNDDLSQPQSSQNWINQQVNKVLLDPARAGALTVVTSIVTLAPTHIVYVSCHPATLARDCQVFVQAGYRIVKISLLDMFPQTKHLESMILLQKE